MSPSIAYDRRAEYLVLGGYVFVPLTTNYLMATRSGGELVYYYQEYYKTVAEEGKTREQLVILSQVLPDASTRYRSYRNAIVAAVDGKVPNDFREFVALVESGKDLVKVDFEGVNVPPLILDREKIAGAHARICRDLNIPEDRHIGEEN